MLRSRGEKWHQPPALSMERGVCTHCCLESPPRRVNNLPSCVPDVPYLSVSGPSSHPAAQCTCVLSQAGWLCFKALNLGSGMVCPPLTGPLGKGLAVLGLIQVCPRRAVAQKCRGVEFGIKHNKEPVSKLATLCTYAEEQRR